MEYKKLTGAEELQLVFSGIDDPEIASRVKECYERAYDDFCRKLADVLEDLIIEWKFKEDE